MSGAPKRRRRRELLAANGMLSDKDDPRLRRNGSASALYDKWQATRKELDAARADATEAVVETLHRTEDELERTRARAVTAEENYRAANVEADEGVAGESVAGKPALAKFRRQTWRKLATAVVNLPAWRQRHGWTETRLIVATHLAADLYTLGLTAPRSVDEARDRDRLRRLLTSRAFLHHFSGSAPGDGILRELWLEQVARAYYRPSVYATFDRAADEGVLDRDRWLRSGGNTP